MYIYIYIQKLIKSNVKKLNIKIKKATKHNSFQFYLLTLRHVFRVINAHQAMIINKNVLNI